MVKIVGYSEDKSQIRVEFGSTKERSEFLEFKARYHPTTKLAECKLCGHGLNKFNRSKIKHVTTGKNLYPSLCKLCVKHLTPTVQLMLARGITNIPRSLLTIGAQGSPSGKSPSEIAKAIRTVAIDNKVSITLTQFDDYAEYVAARNKGVKVLNYGKHTEGDVNSCLACKRDMIDNNTALVIVRVKHERELRVSV